MFVCRVDLHTCGGMIAEHIKARGAEDRVPASLPGHHLTPNCTVKCSSISGEHTQMV